MYGLYPYFSASSSTRSSSIDKRLYILKDNSLSDNFSQINSEDIEKDDREENKKVV